MFCQRVIIVDINPTDNTVHLKCVLKDHLWFPFSVDADFNCNQKETILAFRHAGRKGNCGDNLVPLIWHSLQNLQIVWHRQINATFGGLSHSSSINVVNLRSNNPRSSLVLHVNGAMGKKEVGPRGKTHKQRRYHTGKFPSKPCIFRLTVNQGYTSVLCFCQPCLL